MKKFTASQGITISGDSCGFEIEVEMTVSFTVSKFIPASNDGPAEEPTPDVNEVTFSRNDEDVTLPTWLIDGILDRDGFDAWLMSEAKDQSQQAEEDHADHIREMRQEAS
ncbi:hypothetical protein [Brucella pituitosa]|uniref:hypothetical protein n=1 Tax=Brucella pituitosa TaxID=571256 RepID=UPI003F4AE0E5